MQNDYETNARNLRNQIEQETRMELEEYKFKSEKEIKDLSIRSTEERNKMQQQIEAE